MNHDMLTIAADDIIKEIARKLPVTDAVVILVNRDTKAFKIASAPGDIKSAIEVCKKTIHELENELIRQKRMIA